MARCTARLGDTTYGGYGRDCVHAGSGDDLLFGKAGTNDLECGEGADTLDGGRGDDILHGGGGDDTLNRADGLDVFEAHPAYEGEPFSAAADEDDDIVDGFDRGDDRNVVVSIFDDASGLSDSELFDAPNDAASATGGATGIEEGGTSLWCRA